MSYKRFQNQYRIPSARAKWHDYNGGMYFVTACTQNREHFLGEIQDGVMHLTEIGKCLNEEIIKTPEMRADMNLEIPLYVIMPNHVHLIVIIGNNIYNCREYRNGRDAIIKGCRDAMHCVSTMNRLTNRRDVPWRVSTSPRHRFTTNAIEKNVFLRLFTKL